MDNEKLKSISDAVRDAVRSFNYDFQDRSLHADTFRSHIDSIMMDMFDDKTITQDINKTGFPDAAIIYVLQDKMQRQCSIQDFSSITARWVTCPDRAGYILDVTFKESVSTITAEIDFCEEDTRCE